MAAPVRTVKLGAHATFATRVWDFFRQPHIALAAAAVVALIIVAPWSRESGLELTSGMLAPGEVATDSTIREAAPTEGSQLVDLALSTAELDVLPDSLRVGAKEIVAKADQAGRPAALQGLAPNTDSTIVFPASEVVEETQPELRWKAFGETYNVSIYDSRHRLIARTGRLTETRMRPPSALLRGMTYTWEVENAGQRHIGWFRVLGEQEEKDLAQVRVQYGSSHLVMGAVSEELGLVRQAQTEFEAMAKEKPGSQQAAKLAAHANSL